MVYETNVKLLRFQSNGVTIGPVVVDSPPEVTCKHRSKVRFMF